MGDPGNHIVKRTHCLFVDHVEVYQENHNALKNVQSFYKPATTLEPPMECQSVWKSYSNMTICCEKKTFKCWRKEWRPWSQMNTKFINSWEVNRLMVSKWKQCLKELSKRVANTKLNDANLIKAINMKVIPVAVYSMQWTSADSMLVSRRNWIRRLREKSEEKTLKTKVSEGYVQGNKTACHVLDGQVDQSLD